MSRKLEIEKFVSKKLVQIVAEAEYSEGKAIFAYLRRGIGKRPGEMPEIFGILLQDMPEVFLSKTGVPTKEEWSCYIALTLFALHQQGMNVKTQLMNTNQKVTIGTALSRLTLVDKDTNSAERMLKRLKALATAKDMNELSYHLRGIVQLMKRDSIAINYTLLAGDLYEIQFEENKANVCLKWGQDFYRKNEFKEEEDGGSKNE